MTWQLVLLVVFGGLVLLLASGVPVAFAFMAVNIIGALLIWGGTDPIGQFVLSIYSSISKFSLVPVPLFLLMGEVMFHSGVAFKMMAALDRWIGRIPGRLSLLAVGGGTLFSTLSGSSMASTAMLASVLVPEMQRKGYSTTMSVGPIVAAGTLAIMIPPTSLGVLLASLAQINVGKLLMAIIVPGLMMAVAFAAYIIIRSMLNPKVAPPYDAPSVPWRVRIREALLYILPLASIIFLVIGSMVLGIATPNEASALGALGCFVLAAIYRKGIKWDWLKKSMGGTVKVSGMMLLIVAGSTAFSQILTFTGATGSLVQFAADIDLPRIGILIIMQVVLIVLGMFMEPLSILMVTLPLYIPVAQALEFDLIWFCAIMLLNMEMGAISPPFGLSLFVVKGIMGDSAPLTSIYRSSLPFLALDAGVMTIMIFVPSTVLWLPALMGQ
jgi:tripartite ATP-independent transporter DctM subunit